MKIEQEIRGDLAGQMAGGDSLQATVDIRIGEGSVVIGAIFNGPVHFHLSLNDLPEEELTA